MNNVKFCIFTSIINAILDTKFQGNQLNRTLGTRAKKPPLPPPQLAKSQNDVVYRVNKKTGASFLVVYVIYGSFVYTDSKKIVSCLLP